MPNKETPKWKRFENLVGQVQKTLSPEAEVLLSQKIVGRKTKVQRQVDILVRQSVGQYKITIIVECKDYNRPVDVKDIEKFIGLIDDTGANKGALVAANGFTDAARARAVGSGIDLYGLVDAEAHDWQTYVTIPVVCDFRGLGKVRARFGYSSVAARSWLATQDSPAITLYKLDRHPLGMVLQLVWLMWNQHQLPSEPGEYSGVTLLDGDFLICLDDGTFHEVKATIDLEVISELYFGQVPLINVKGFQDQVTGDLHTAGFTTDFIDVAKVEQHWLKIESAGVLAVKPLLTLKALDVYPGLSDLSNYKS
jgi:hypothetical protein